MQTAQQAVRNVLDEIRRKASKFWFKEQICCYRYNSGLIVLTYDVWKISQTCSIDPKLYSPSHDHTYTSSVIYVLPSMF